MIESVCATIAATIAPSPLQKKKRRRTLQRKKRKKELVPKHMSCVPKSLF